jgi:hypothetical protein
MIRVGDGAARMTVRVQLEERWETLAFDTASDSPVLALKHAALAHFGQADVPAEDFVLKLRGVEILDEQESLAAATARDGSTFLLAFRRRRPVR